MQSIHFVLFDQMGGGQSSLRFWSYNRNLEICLESNLWGADERSLILFF